MARGTAIRTRGLTRRFGELVAVDHVDLDIGKALVYGFLGPNGSGKSTTMRMLLGLLHPSEGEVEVLGLPIPKEAEALKRRTGYMTQRFSLYDDLSVAENLRFLAAVQGFGGRERKRRVERVIEAYRLGDQRRQLAGTLSGGQRQRLALAGAVLHEPELLLLDEPTSAVDPESRREFWDHLFALADAGTTLLVSTHFMDEAERCHRLAILDRGRLVADDTPAKLTEGIGYRVLMVDTDRPREAQSRLVGREPVAAVAQIGAALRVLIPEDAGSDDVRELLRGNGVDAELREVPPNLEDVFVAVTRLAGRRERTGSAPMAESGAVA